MWTIIPSQAAGPRWISLGRAPSSWGSARSHCFPSRELTSSTSIVPSVSELKCATHSSLHAAIGKTSSKNEDPTGISLRAHPTYCDW